MSRLNPLVGWESNVTVTCREGEEYQLCGSCENTCEDPFSKRPCPSPCNPGCVCQKGFVRARDRRCIRPQHCNIPTCGENEEYSECGSSCPLTCSNYQESVFCTKGCAKGCFCKSGYVEGPNKKCILPQKCPIGPCRTNEVANDCVNPCNTCVQRGKCFYEFCSRGCDCRPGHFRNSTGHCVLAALCDVAESMCPKHEHYVPCINLCNDCWSRGDCEQSYCQPGCDCDPGFFRDDNGDCIPESQCISEEVACGINEEYTDCVNPCNDCIKQGNCQYVCQYGCDCKKGYFRDPKGLCIPAEQCSAEPGIESKNCRNCRQICPANEQFYVCKPTCRNSCDNFNDTTMPCSLECTSGCFCKKGYVKRKDGACVPPTECPRECGLHEEYRNCGPACPATCSSLSKSVPCTHQCVKGCFCKSGYIRGPQGTCIRPELCPGGQNVTVNGDRYRAMITNFFIPGLNNHDVQELWFQQDGATCHTARATIDLLKDTFGDRLISRFGPVNWPPRSCDLTPLDYFLWGYVKSLVYADKLQTLDHLEDNIRRVIADIRQQMLEKVLENWTPRLDYIRASRGSPMPEIIFKIQYVGYDPRLVTEWVRVRIPKCGENEEYNECGPACAPTCMTLGQTVSCHHECVRGCFCKPGYVRGPNGKCINPSLCPAVCGKNEVFLQCGTACPASCRTLSNPRNLPCPNHCVKGCFCKEGFVRGPDGTCIPPTTCPSICGDKEEFKVCGTACPATCTNHTTPRPCPTLCVKGCFCLPGYVRGPEGKCILPQSCPVVCGEREEYMDCGPPCPFKCEDMSKGPCSGPCIKGCFCKKGFVRGPDGKCILPALCPAGVWLKEIWDPLRVLPLTPTHRRLRLEWCRARGNWTLAEGNQIVFSDESRFNLSSDGNRARVWRPRGERPKPAFAL
ncbi:zonadhesin [Trichonephila clavipes]|nr:zonadhesin [Trichonephila clavipes]